jgi:catechol 2,3-dioxygenase-like lactoylglutathione lyase family enzyme
MAEFDEVEQARAKGIDIFSGYRHVDSLPASYDVDGVLLPRPFKIVRLGPVYLFTENLDKAAEFYCDTLGFTLTEEVTWRDERCLFLRANTEHHSVTLFPLTLREALGLSPHSKCAAFGIQLANYRQLRDAVKFFRDNGVEVTESLPHELHPGIEYSATVRDPDGHTIQLYYAMEQIGWEGKPRPKDLRKPRKLDEWPETLNDGNAYLGEAFSGPWA